MDVRRERKQNLKQITYSVFSRNEEEKYAIFNSNLAFVRDWRLGWFDVPHEMKDEFKSLFDIAIYENSACNIGVTKEDIRFYNISHWPGIVEELMEKLSLNDKIAEASNKKSEYLKENKNQKLQEKGRI